MKDMTREIWESFYSDSNYMPIAPYTDSMAMLARRFSRNGSGKKLLEIGCGVAQNLLFASWSMDFETYGIDFSEVAIQAAVENFQKKNVSFAELEVGDVKNLKYSDDFFDAIIERGVLQLNSLDRIKEIVKELRRVLKKGGCLSCSFLSENNAYYGQGEDLGNGDFYNDKRDGMRHYFSRSDIGFVFEGFKIERLQHTERKDLLNMGLAIESFYNVEMVKV
jgi:SAM-dependent methyltransferase